MLFIQVQHFCGVEPNMRGISAEETASENRGREGLKFVPLQGLEVLKGDAGDPGDIVEGNILPLPFLT